MTQPLLTYLILFLLALMIPMLFVISLALRRLSLRLKDLAHYLKKGGRQ